MLHWSCTAMMLIWFDTILPTSRRHSMLTFLMDSITAQNPKFATLQLFPLQNEYNSCTSNSELKISLYFYPSNLVKNKSQFVVSPWIVFSFYSLFRIRIALAFSSKVHIHWARKHCEMRWDVLVIHPYKKKYRLAWKLQARIILLYTVMKMPPIPWTQNVAHCKNREKESTGVRCLLILM